MSAPTAAPSPSTAAKRPTAERIVHVKSGWAMLALDLLLLAAGVACFVAAGVRSDAAGFGAAEGALVAAGVVLLVLWKLKKLPWIKE